MENRCLIRVVVLDGVDWVWAVRSPASRALWGLIGMEQPDVGPPHETVGCAAMLRSCSAPITPSAVCALLAGRDDGVGWFTDDRYATSQELIRTRPWLHELKRHEMTVGLINVPLTWPAFPLPRGSYMVSGYPLSVATDPVRPWRWPAGLDVTGYPVDAVVEDSCAPGGGTLDLDGLVEAEARIVHWALTRAPRATVEVVWLRSTDAAGHRVWGEQKYEDVAQHACECAAELAEGAENLIVISDHGFDHLDSPRCDAYHRTTHGPAARREGLVGGHSEEGILFARGPRIQARGVLPDQQLVHVAGGLFDLLQIPPAPGMTTGAPSWSAPVSQEEAGRTRAALASLGYSDGA